MPYLLISQGMRQGIITSGAFILFLSAGILTRPFCRFLIVLAAWSTHLISLCSVQGQFEIRAAIAHKKPIVLIRTSFVCNRLHKCAPHARFR